MFRIRVNAYHVGLVFRNDEFRRTLTEGLHWIRPGEHVVRYDCTLPFSPSVDLKILLKDENLAELLHYTEVEDGSLVLVFEGNNFKAVLTEGRYAYFKEPLDYRFVKVDLTKIEITAELSSHVLTHPLLQPYLRVYEVAPYEKAILLVDNQLERELGPGKHYFWRNAIPIRLILADTRQLQLEMNGQEMLTNDKAALRINFYAEYRIVDAKKALFENQNFEKQLYLLLQLTLRSFIGRQTLDHLLTRKEDISANLLEEVAQKALNLGVEVIYCGVRDIILPGEVKEILNQVLIAQKKAQANIIMRREETASTRSLLNTAKLMEDNEMLFKLKEMEYIEKIAEKINAISLAGGGHLLEQLKGVFTPVK